MDDKRKEALDITALEKNLPYYLWNDIQLWVESIKNNGFLQDCILGEFEADLKNALRSNEVTRYQAIYLEKKYFENATQEELQRWFEKTFDGR
ncbi:MAG: hypothetical protein H6Q72_3684 [Firmicutes bacterium]|nr:hypothetical protein [Bacillota bacterium]